MVRGDKIQMLHGCLCRTSQSHHLANKFTQMGNFGNGKFSFSQRTVNEWNRLSADCVGASSVSIFKNKIDIYLRRARYT